MNQEASETGRPEHPLVFYDGVCGLCNRTTRFILKRDPEGLFRFAPLQSAFASEVLPRHGADPAALDTLFVLTADDPEAERLLERSDAVLWILARLSKPWPLFALLARRVPRAPRDLAYRLLARHRYRIFGRSDACEIPAPTVRARFLVD